MDFTSYTFEVVPSTVYEGKIAFNVKTMDFKDGRWQNVQYIIETFMDMPLLPFQAADHRGVAHWLSMIFSSILDGRSNLPRFPERK